MRVTNPLRRLFFLIALGTLLAFIVSACTNPAGNDPSGTPETPDGVVATFGLRVDPRAGTVERISEGGLAAQRNLTNLDLGFRYDPPVFTDPLEGPGDTGEMQVVFHFENRTDAALFALGTVLASDLSPDVTGAWYAPESGPVVSILTEQPIPSGELGEDLRLNGVGEGGSGFSMVLRVEYGAAPFDFFIRLTTYERLEQIAPVILGSDREVLGDWLYFQGDDGVRGRELWRTNGTITELVADINPGMGNGDPNYFTHVDEWLYFTANDGVHGYELWRSNGALTEMVKDIWPGSNHSNPDDYNVTVGLTTSSGGQLYFTADDGVHGRELWRSNGIITEMVKDIWPGVGDDGPHGSFPHYLTLSDDALIFVADDGVHGRELWRSDGTPEGTVLIEDIRPGEQSSYPEYWVTPFRDQYYFSADDGIHGNELWRTDGVSAELVADINPGGGNGYPNEFTSFDGWLYFSADDSVYGSELWRTNGVTTELFSDINPGRDRSVPSRLTPLDGWLYFSAYDNAHGTELRRTNGAVTELVADIWPGSGASPVRPGPGNASPDLLTVLGGALYFRAHDGVHGVELWRTDGTTAGTQLVGDISGPSVFAVFDGALLMRAGNSLWKLTP